jgi:polyadenylate-binding protein 2
MEMDNKQLVAASTSSFDEEHDSFDLGDAGQEEPNFDVELVEGDQHENISGNGEAEATMEEDPELEAIKRRVKEMEEEAEKIRQMQNEVEKQMTRTPAGQTPAANAVSASPSLEDKVDADGRSIWIGNVDYGATAEELEQHFHGCGPVNRITILCDKFTGHPKGFAYMEFAEKDAVDLAMALDDSLFRGRQIQVTAKRTNRPGISTTNRPPRGGRFRPSRSAYHYGYAPRASRGRFRPRRSFYYSPY